MLIGCVGIYTTGESDAKEISFACTSSLGHAPNPHLEAVLALEREGERGSRGEGEEEGGKRGEVTLLHLMDDDDDD